MADRYEMLRGDFDWTSARSIIDMPVVNKVDLLTTLSTLLEEFGTYEPQKSVDAMKRYFIQVKLGDDKHFVRVYFKDEYKTPDMAVCFDNNLRRKGGRKIEVDQSGLDFIENWEEQSDSDDSDCDTDYEDISE